MLESTRDRRSRLRERHPHHEIARMPLALASQRGARWWSANLHVLIDEGRHARLTEESKRTGRSVGDIVRSAIDLHFDEERDRARRAAAARFLLATADTGDGPGETWDEMLDARARDIEEMLET